MSGGLDSDVPSADAPARVRGVALAAMLADLDPTRRDLAFRVYFALRRRKLSRTLSADLAARACAVADTGMDLEAIATELRVPVGLLAAAAPGVVDDSVVESGAPEAATDAVARDCGVTATDAYTAVASRLRSGRAKPRPNLAP